MDWNNVDIKEDSCERDANKPNLNQIKEVHRLLSIIYY